MLMLKKKGAQYNQNKLNKTDKNLFFLLQYFLCLSVFTLWYCYLEQLQSSSSSFTAVSWTLCKGTRQEIYS